MSVIRRAKKAGSWYDESGEILNYQLENWLAEAKRINRVDKGIIKAVIAPHAGYSYSGSTAAFAYDYLNPGQTKVIFVLGPSHHVHFTCCLISSATVLETPLGNLSVNKTIREELLQTGLFESCSREIDEAEHSIEMHLPYIAKVSSGYDDVTVVPIMVGNVNSSAASRYGNILATYLDRPDTAFVVSSDFCHWGRRFNYQPFDPTKGSSIHEYIDWLDHQAMALIVAQDRRGFCQYLEQTHNTICGRNPITLLLATMEKSTLRFKADFVHYAQSSAVVNQGDSSVSYASAIIEQLV